MHGKGLHIAKDKQPGKKLEDVACKRGSLFQVCDFQPGFFHSSSRSHLKLELCIASKGCETSTCQSIYPVAISGKSLHSPLLAIWKSEVPASADARLMSQSYHMCEGVVTHPS